MHNRRKEEYEPHIDNNIIVYAGVDYEVILKEAEKKQILFYGTVVIMISILPY